MSEVALQQEFAQAAAALIQKAKALGYGVTLGEAWRTQEQADWNAAHGLGIAHSLHEEKLAIDLNLFKPDGTFITDSTGHDELGAWWKSLGDNYRWGGDFSTGDFNHYSITPDGVRA
jgi:hypothetical protein